MDRRGSAQAGEGNWKTTERVAGEEAWFLIAVR